MDAICRACSIVQPRVALLTDWAPFSTPRKDYGEILKELAKIELNYEYESYMPQSLCNICCNDLKQFYNFVRKVQKSNDKLSKKLDQIHIEDDNVCIKSENQGAASDVVKHGKSNSVGDDIGSFEFEDMAAEENVTSFFDAFESASKLERRDSSTKTSLELSYESANSTDIEVEQAIVELTTNNESCSEDDSLSANDVLENTICPTCNKVLDSRGDLLKHMLEKHKDIDYKKMFSCDYCARTFDDENNLKYHLIHTHKTTIGDDTVDTKKHSETENRYKCASCDYCAKSHAALHFHKLSKHGTEDDKIKCKFCSYCCFKKFDMLIHVKKAHLATIKMLKKSFDKKKKARKAIIVSPVCSSDEMDTVEEQKISDECSSGDEHVIRRILDMKKRLPKSKLLSSVKPYTSDKPVPQYKPRQPKLTDDENNTTCPLCENDLETRDDLLTHMLMEHREECMSVQTKRMFNCDQCFLEYDNKDQLKVHLMEKHNTQTKPVKIKPQYTIEHTGQLSCRLCDYKTKTYAGLHFHTRSKHGTEVDKYKCKFCSYICIKKFDLLHHTKRVHLAIVKSIKKKIVMNKNKEEMSGDETESNGSCRLNMSYEELESLVCDLQDATADDATEDTLEVSSGDEDTIREIINMKKRTARNVKIERSSSFARRCEECGQIYRNSRALSSHIQAVHGDCEYSQCQHCDRKYKRKYDLKVHCDMKHPPPNTAPKPLPNPKREKRFMCTECAYVTTTTQCLRVHVSRHHTGDKPYQCEFCPKSFVVKFDLKTHQYLHTGERPFKCTICGKGFRDKTHMHRHVRTHSEIKPYNCSDCGKGFSKNYNLSIHRRTHMKGQRLKCSICNKYFKDAAQLNVHQISENHHEEVVE